MSGRQKVVGYTSQYSVRNVRLLQSHNSISCEIKYTIWCISKYNLLLKKTKMGQDIGYRKISINIYIENIGFFFFLYKWDSNSRILSNNKFFYIYS